MYEVVAPVLSWGMNTDGRVIFPGTVECPPRCQITLPYSTHYRRPVVGEASHFHSGIDGMVAVIRVVDFVGDLLRHPACTLHLTACFRFLAFMNDVVEAGELTEFYLGHAPTWDMPDLATVMRARYGALG